MDRPISAFVSLGRSVLNGICHKNTNVEIQRKSGLQIRLYVGDMIRFLIKILLESLADISKCTLGNKAFNPRVIEKTKVNSPLPQQTSLDNVAPLKTNVSRSILNEFRHS